MRPRWRARSAAPAGPRTPLEVAAGFASGLAGTVAAVGGPYLGLAYADRPGPVLRATVSLAFAVGVVLSLRGGGGRGRGPARAGAARRALVPATFLGLLVRAAAGAPPRRRAGCGPRCWPSPARRALFALVRGLF